VTHTDAIETLATAAAAEAMSSAMGETCRNCGEGLTGVFCARCGQSVNDRSKSLWRVVGDALQDFLHFDSRVLRTLGLLLLVPGRMTRDYIVGRRSRYVPPLRLYLFSSLIFFLVLSFANVALIVIELVKTDPPDPAKLESVIGEMNRDLAADGAPPSAEEIARHVERITEATRQATPTEIRAGAESFILPPGTSVQLRFFVDLDGWQPQVRASDLALAQLGIIPGLTEGEGDGQGPPDAPAPPRAPAAGAGAADGLEVMAEVEMERLDEAIGNIFGRDWDKRLLRGIATSLDHPESLNQVLGDNIAKMMFVVMPLYAVVLSLLYWRRRLYFVDHLAFALHVHAFIFVLFTLIVLVREIGGLDVLESAEGAGWLAALMAVYSWLALKRAYGQGAVRTTIKWMLLGWCYSFVLLFGFVTVLMISLPSV